MEVESPFHLGSTPAQERYVRHATTHMRLMDMYRYNWPFTQFVCTFGRPSESFLCRSKNVTMCKATLIDTQSKQTRLRQVCGN